MRLCPHMPAPARRSRPVPRWRRSAGGPHSRMPVVGESTHSSRRRGVNMSANRATWSSERIELLKRCFHAGLSCSQIAREIGVTRNAVIGKMNRLGPLPRAEDIPIHNGCGCTLLELGQGRCRWPINNPGSADFCFCGNEPVNGLPHLPRARAHRVSAGEPAAQQRARVSDRSTREFTAAQSSARARDRCRRRSGRWTSRTRSERRGSLVATASKSSATNSAACWRTRPASARGKFKLY